MMEGPFEIPSCGALVALCGVDGSGKSTQVRLLAEHLQRTHRVHTTRQPTTAFREDPMMRALMHGLVTGQEFVEAGPEIGLFAAADRYRHIRTEVVPRLRAGEVVISDRYVYTCYAYSKARGFSDLRWVREINRFVPVPDATFYLDVSAETAARRIMARGDVPREEELDLSAIEQARAVFREQPWGRDERYHVLDGTRPVDELAAEIRELTEKALSGKTGLAGPVSP